MKQRKINWENKMKHPGYLSQTLCAYEPRQNLWEAPESPRAQHQNVQRAFLQLSCTILASVWNSLPSDLRNSSTLPLFKSKLKTDLFTAAFCQYDLCSLQPPPPPLNLPPTPTLTPHMNVLPECFSCFSLREWERVQGAGEMVGRERDYVCMWDKKGGGCMFVCVCVFSVVIALIT